MLKPVHKTLLDLVEQRPDLPSSILSLWTGLSPTEVKKVREEHGLTRNFKRKQSTEDRQPLTDLHRQIGMRLATRVQLDEMRGDREFAAIVGWSWGKTRSVFAGVAPLDVRDLEVIADYLGTTPDKIISLQF